MGVGQDPRSFSKSRWIPPICAIHFMRSGARPGRRLPPPKASRHCNAATYQSHAMVRYGLRTYSSSR